jgi:anti-sigma factor RsiW
MSRHLSSDEFVDHIYGISSAEQEAVQKAHLECCPECQAEMRLHEQRRKLARGEEVLSGPVTALLARQRDEILARIERPRYAAMRWVPAVVAAGLLVAVALVPRASQTNAPPADPVKPEIYSDQALRDAFSLESEEVPRAASPLQALFEVPAGDEQ